MASSPRDQEQRGRTMASSPPNQEQSGRTATTSSPNPDQEQSGRTMTSSPDPDQEQRGRTTSPSSSNQDQSKTMQGYPPAPGYPHPHGHSGGYPSGYQGYPPQGYPSGPQPYPPQPYAAYPNHPNPYPYTATPPAAYYTPQPHLPSHPEPSSGIDFARAVFLMMMLLVLGTIFMSLITWLFFGSEIPSFKVESLSVPNFNVTSATLDATFEANMKVRNTNKKIDMFFNNIEAVMSYENDVLAIGLVDSLQLGRLQEGSLVSKIVAAKGESNGVRGETMREMSQDRSTGTVIFNLRMAIGGSYTSGALWKRHIRLRVFCDGLKVEFAAATGVGKLVPDAHKDCLIYV